jgi:hypothetical protein
MGKGLLFFCCSCCILVLTIINLSVGPIISKRVGDKWGLLNCEQYKDEKDGYTNLSDEEDKYYQSHIDGCIRMKGMHDMEYTAFIFDIVIGFICGLIGLLHLFDLKKDFVSNTGLIGLICGIVGFVLTFVYVIFNGIVFTSKYSDELERDGDGIFAEWDASANAYKCVNYDKEDYYSGHAKFSDLNKKQYNYKHDFYDTAASTCEDNSNYIGKCDGNYNTIDGKLVSTLTKTLFHNCQYVYAQAEDGITNKDIFDRFLTALILSLVVCLANIGLALFGFLLFRTPGDF